jgi:tetratricopeptide (TPR) repeat protein
MKAGELEPLERGSLVIGSLLPLLSPAGAVAYFCRRYETIKKEGTWAGWPVVVVISIATIGVAIGVITQFEDPTTAGNTPLEDLGVFLLVAATLLPGFAAYFDLRYLKKTEEYDFPRHNWLWILGLMIWFVQFIVIIGWFIWRIKISSKSNHKQILSVVFRSYSIVPDTTQPRQNETSAAETVREPTEKADSDIDPANSSDMRSIDKLRADATSAFEEATTAEKNGDFEGAIQFYLDTIDKIEQASEAGEILSDAGEQELEEELKIARQNLDNVTNRHEQQTVLRETLQTAERSFQEAIAAYIDRDRTLSQIRFRQARNGFEEAYETVDDDAESLLEQTITTEPQQTLPSNTLKDFPQLSDETLELLSAVDIISVQDISIKNDSVTPAMVDTFEDRGLITEKEEATLFTILSWWHGEEPVKYSTLDKIYNRIEQSKYGFDKSS